MRSASALSSMSSKTQFSSMLATGSTTQTNIGSARSFGHALLLGKPGGGKGTISKKILKVREAGR
jgi:hypothetical protein